MSARRGGSPYDFGPVRLLCAGDARVTMPYGTNGYAMNDNGEQAAFHPKLQRVARERRLNMSAPGSRRGTLRGNPLDELLLRAALSAGPEAITAWQEWQRCASLSSLDPAARRLVPLLCRNLRQHGVDVIPEQLSETVLITWLENQMLFTEAATVIETFASEGIESILLKGAALALGSYGDAALRPMNDVDLLVPPENARAAIASLRRAGWEPDYAEPERLIGFQHAVGFRHPRGGRCDLHWRALWGGASDDAGFRRRTIAVNICGVRAAALSAPDQLLHVCVHGMAWSELPLGWIADAIMILRHASSPFDWDCVVEEAVARRLVAPMRATLRYLHSFAGELVPRHVVDRFDRLPVSRTEQLMFALRSGRGRAFRRLPLIAYLLRRWRESDERLASRVRNLVHYVRTHLTPHLPFSRRAEIDLRVPAAQRRND